MERCLNKNVRYLLTGILGVLLFGTGFCSKWVAPVQAETLPGPTIAVMIDGKGIPNDARPVIKNRRLLVPIRAIAENTGAQIAYEDRAKRILVSGQEKEMALFVGRSFAYVNGKRVQLDTAPIIMNRRTMVPLRFINEQLGYEVNWDASSQVAIVNTEATAAAETTRYIGNQISKEEILSNADEQELLSSRFVFPFGRFGVYEPFTNTYGDERSWNDDGEESARKHEGIDIMAEKGTPIYAASDGVINRIGWNTYGGWRVNITDKSGKYKLYYAHLSGYVPALRLYGSVKAGQLIGFVGDSGYGSAGTIGMFPPHLHFGLYDTGTDKAFNPYYYLKMWEMHTVHN